MTSVTQARAGSGTCPEPAPASAGVGCPTAASHPVNLPGEGDQKMIVATPGQPGVPAGGVVTGCCTGPDWMSTCELERTCS